MRPVRPAVLALLLVSASCRQPPRPEPEPEAAAKPAATHAGPEACRPCHADQWQAWSASSHRTTVREVQGSGADFAKAADAALPGVSDAPPSVAGRPALLAIGGQRFVDLLGEGSRGLEVLPLSWSVTGSSWVDARTRAARPASGERPEPFAEECARCHPVSARVHGPDVPMSPAGAADLPPGITCEHCHGPGGAHAADPASARMPGLRGSDPWDGCGHCHARGPVLRRRAGTTLGAGQELLDHVLPEILTSGAGFSESYRLDGMPGSPHGFEVQALEQSACRRLGGATCLTCHDPHGSAHGGQLRVADPDASCRDCHADVAAAGSAHAAHPIAAEPVPASRLEPGGPAPRRLPGCVDCHAPALLAWGDHDRIRTHALTVPEPRNLADHGLAEACDTCHGPGDAARQVRHVASLPGQRDFQRHRRARAFATAVAEATGPQLTAEPVSAERLAALLAEPATDAWTKAAVAEILGGFGASAAGARPRVVELLSSEDPVVAPRAARAVAAMGTADPAPLRPLLERDDWRIQVAGAAALSQLGDPRGAVALESLRARPDLPPEAQPVILFEVAMAVLREGATRRAALLLEEVTRLQPDNVAAWLNLGTLRATLGDVEGARLAWHAVLDLRPGEPLATRNLQALDDAAAP